MPLDVFNHLFLKQMHYLWVGEEDAIASSDITKAPFVAAVALRGDLRISSEAVEKPP